MRWVIEPEPITLLDSDGTRLQEADQKAIKKAIADATKAARAAKEKVPETVEMIMKDVPVHSTMVYLERYVFDAMEKVDGHEEKFPKLGRRVENGRGFAANRRATELYDAFKNAKPGQAIGIQDDTWEIVKEIIAERSIGPSIGRQLYPIENAWHEATAGKPAVDAQGVVRKNGQSEEPAGALA